MTARASRHFVLLFVLTSFFFFFFSRTPFSKISHFTPYKSPFIGITSHSRAWQALISTTSAKTQTVSPLYPHISQQHASEEPFCAEAEDLDQLESGGGAVHHVHRGTVQREAHLPCGLQPWEGRVWRLARVMGTAAEKFRYLVSCKERIYIIMKWQLNV